MAGAPSKAAAAKMEAKRVMAASFCFAFRDETVYPIFVATCNCYFPMIGA